jgi:hypothetical protein
MTPDQFEAWLQSQRAQEEAHLLTLRFRAEDAAREFVDAENFIQCLFDREWLKSCGIEPLN